MLRIDLLPGHFAAARAAKRTLVLMALALLVTVLACFGMLTMKKAEFGRVTKDRDEWKVKADEVRGIETKAGEKEALAAPIDTKVSFIEDADGCGEQWWDAFEKVNRYIYAQARVTAIRFQAPNAVHFEVDVPDTTACGRFVLNLIRCPDISNIRIGGSPPGGPGIGPNARASGGGGGMGGGMPGMGMGGPEMGMGGGMPGPEMGGGMPGMPGMGGMGGGGGPAASSQPGGPIHLSVDASLAQPLSTPAPGGGAAAGAGGMPGAPGGMPGAPGGAMPGMPGAGGAAPMGPSGGAPSGPPSGGSKAGGEGGDEGGGGLGKKRDVDVE